MQGFWDVFLERVRQNPAAIALIDGDKKISYAELQERAAAIGGVLRRKGAIPEKLIGLRLEKSAEYIIAMLGVWHAGAAFVPLPPSLPKERADYIAMQAGITDFLEAKDLVNLPACPDAPATLQENQLAYVIYTSGSTGRPKGVMVEHRGIVNFIEAQRKDFSVTAESRYLFSLSVNFDASVSDIGVALLSGAALVIAPDDIVRDGRKFLGLIHAKKITHMDVPPSLLKILPVANMPPSMQTIVIGGEICPVPVVREWASKFRLVNVYGPTEATVCTSLCLCDPKKWDKPLIGNPLPGVTYHILDEDLNEVKEGELYIGGRQLARGYLGNPELTNKKFISHKGQRLYKTGDKVRRHAKEDIEFIGRIDRQFKLRGQLVEPDEIEARILDYPGIERVAVIKKSESLAAFVQARGDLDIAKVKEFLSGKLPPWMIPQHMHILPEIPLTATGKPDFAVLQNIDLATGESSRVQPESDVEKKIFSAWKNVLRHENFGVTDSFFQIGGDSLGVIRLTLEAERQGIAVSAGLLSEYPTIRLLAAAIEGDLDGADVMSADDLRQQVAFETAWQDLFRQAEKRSGYPDMSNILLTGAAGFLGSRVLHELLQQTKATVYCLIRAKDTAAGLDRIKATLDKYELRLSSSDIARIVPICGDLTEKDFGIPNWQDMAEQIDAVYHCAAIVNMTASSRDLWPANVEGTQEVLRFCCEGKKKSLHYASTLSVFVSTDQNKGRLLESDRLEKTRQVYGGYAQTKWAAEYMLLQVPKKACTISHYRFGLITGDVKNGIGPCNDFLAMFARGMASLGAAPEDFEDILQVDITPVDYAARAMVEISLKGDKDIYHIANPKSMTLGGILSALKRGGKNVNLLPVAQWRGLAARADLTTEETAAILGLCRALPPEDFNSRRSMDLFQATDVVFDRRETALVTGAECPPASDSLMDLYIKGIFKGLY